MSKKYQEDLRRLVGLEDGGKTIDAKQDREDIASSRGVAYFSSAGNVASGNSVPDDIQDAQTDEAENGDGTDGNSTDGSGTGTTRNNQYCADGSIRPYSTGLCPEDIAAATTPYDSLAAAANSGSSVKAIGGLFDCTNGDSVRISFGFDGIAPETASDPTDPNNLNNLITDPDTGLPILDENGEAQFNGDQTSSACIPPPNWERCDCYQPEKRGGLKPGWDSVQMWHEAVNCGADPSYSEGQFYESEKISQNISSTAIGNAGIDPNERAYGYTHNSLAQQCANFYVRVYGDSPTVGAIETVNQSAGIYRVLITNTTEGSEYFYWYRYNCSSRYIAEWCDTPPNPEPEICDQYPEQCENGNTDDESCHPLELLQAEQCCEPDDTVAPDGEIWFNYFDGYTIQGQPTVQLAIDGAFTGYYADEIEYVCKQETISDTVVRVWYQTTALGIPANTCHGPFDVVRNPCVNFGASADAWPHCNGTIPRDPADYEKCKLEDGTQDYTVDAGGVTPSPSDGDIPQENAETTAEKTFCNDSGQQVKIVQGLNGGTVIRNDTTGVHYYRDPETGKLSFFDNTELTRYLPAS